MRGQTDCPNTRGYFFFLVSFFLSLPPFLFFPSFLDSTSPACTSQTHPVFSSWEVCGRQSLQFRTAGPQVYKKKIFFPHQRCLVIWTFSSAPATHTHIATATARVWRILHHTFQNETTDPAVRRMDGLRAQIASPREREKRENSKFLEPTNRRLQPQPLSYSTRQQWGLRLGSNLPTCLPERNYVCLPSGDETPRVVVPSFPGM